MTTRKSGPDKFVFTKKSFLIKNLLAISLISVQLKLKREQMKRVFEFLIFLGSLLNVKDQVYIGLQC